MNKLYDSLKKRYEDLLNQNISHEELGENGLQEAEKIENRICNYVLYLLETTYKYRDKLDQIIVNQLLKFIDVYYNKINSVRGKIDQLLKAGIHHAQYPSKRNEIINEYNIINNDIRKDLLIYDTKLKQEKIESIDDIDKYFEDIKSKSDLADTIIEKMRDEITEKAIDESQKNFADLGDTHKKREFWWFVATSIFGFVFCVIIYLYIKNKVVSDNYLMVINNNLKYLIPLSTAGVFFRICLRRYSIERNLRIIYDHRATALQLYEKFELGIEENPDAKKQLRLEIVKIIFADPQTGYIKDSSGSEVNIHPIINLMEKFTK